MWNLQTPFATTIICWNANTTNSVPDNIIQPTIKNAITAKYNINIPIF